MSIYRELRDCETMVFEPVESTSPFDVNLVLRKTCVIRDGIEKYYTTHHPKV